MPTLDAYAATLREQLTEALADHGVPGAVVGIVRGDEQAIVAAGVGNVSTGVDCTPQTIFQIGSISKVYTATLVLQLVQAGLVELDEPVRGALQEFRVADDSATLTITPRHLLSHTSGIQGDHFIDCGRNPDALWRFVSTLEDVGQLHAPDDLFSYCNAGYGVLGRLVEEATGDHFTRALQRRLLRPLDVQRTVTLAEQAIVHRVAAGHRRVDGAHVVQPWTLARFNVPIGGILADAADVLAVARLHLSGGKSASGTQVVPGRALVEMREPQVDVPGGGAWGLGWELSEWDGHPVLAHSGDTVGQRCFLRLVPDLDAAVVVLTNSPIGDFVASTLFASVGNDVLGLTTAPEPEPLAVEERPDPDACSGIYERMHQRLAIAGGKNATLRMTIIPDELFSMAGMRERTLTLEPVGEGRYTALDPDTGIRQAVTMTASDEDDETDDPARPRFVHFGRRAHARIA